MSNVIITIGRQYGSGGRYIGELAAKELGIAFYDEELITLAADKSDLCHEAAFEADERNASSLLYTLAMGSSTMLHSSHYNMPINDKLFLAQSEIIRDIAHKESAVIVGRCADYVLREHPNTFSVFIYADEKLRIKNIMKRSDISENEARSLMSKTDRRRANYYNYYTGQKWGKLENFDIALDSAKLGVDKTADMLYHFITYYKEQYLND